MEDAERATEAVLFALARAHRDSLHPTIREEGIDERDLAYEAGLLQPAEMESSIYGTQKRSRILRLLRQMQTRELITMEMAPPGVYRIHPTEAGARYAEFLMRPWYIKLLDRLQGRKPLLG